MTVLKEAGAGAIMEGCYYFYGETDDKSAMFCHVEDWGYGLKISGPDVMYDVRRLFKPGVKYRIIIRPEG